MKPTSLAFASMTTLTTVLAPVGAMADTVRLRVADSLPAGHIISETLTKPWMERVRALSDGAIDLQYYPAEQIGKAKDFLALTRTG